MKKVHFLLLLLLALFGLVISIHLTRIHYPLLFGESEAFPLCKSGCDVVNGSRYSEVLGIPLSSYGAVFYGVLFLFGFFGLLFRKTYGEAVLSLTAFLSFAAIAVDAYLLYISWVHLKAFCGLCGLTYLVNLNCLLVSLWGLKSPRRIFSILGGEIRKAFSLGLSPEKSPGPYYQKVVSFLLILLFLLSSLVGLTLSYAYDLKYKGLSPEKRKEFLVQYDALPRQQVFPHQAPSSGPSGASLTIVDFSDFKCPHCRYAANILKRLLGEYRGRFRVVFKQFPNDSACNPNIPSDHPSSGSCFLAKAALCAHVQNRFWEYHDLLFANQDTSYTEGKLVSAAKEMGLTQETFAACLHDPKTDALLRSEIDEGLALGVKGTPVLFFNGKMVRGNPPPELTRILIDKELGRR